MFSTSSEFFFMNMTVLIPDYFIKPTHQIIIILL